MKKSTVAIIIVALLAVCGFGGWKYHEAQIAKMQEAGVSTLRSSIDLEAYRDDEKTAISAILDDSEKAIRECKEQEAIDVIIADAKDSFTEFKTDAELTAEEEAARLAELERQRKEKEKREKEEAERQAALAAQQAAAASSGRSSSGGSGSRDGCVGGGKDVFN